MTSLNTAEKIKSYITKNESDNIGSWEYEHIPYLTKSLNELNEVESKEFIIKISNWKEFHLSQIADSIIFSDNRYLDTDFLYLNIFSKVKNIENLDYLVENIVWQIPELPKYKIESWSLEFIISLKENVLKTMDVKSNSWKESLIKVIIFLDNEIIKRQ